MFDWSSQEQLAAAVFGSVLLLASAATPTGMLRLYDRFDIIAYTDAVAPVLRLVGSIAAWISGAGVFTFLAIWAFSALAHAVARWIAALHINKPRIRFGRAALQQALSENERLWRFMWQTNVSSSVSLFWLQLGTMAVGAVAGPAEAGGFRLARRLAKGIVAPFQTVTLALYPELARLVAQDNQAELKRVVTRVTAVASGLALLAVAVTSVASREILFIFAGKEYEFAAIFLLLLSISSAVDLMGFAFEPLQNAFGRSWKVLRTKLIAAVVYGALLVVLLPRIGARGAAVAAIVCSLMIFVQLAVLTVRLLRRRTSPPPVQSA
jgi:O-antigen/teichoic acid export membrane protein